MAAGTRTAGLKDALVEVLGDARRVGDGDSELDTHAADLTFHAPRRPDVVVYPLSTAEVAAVLALASELAVPVTPFGAGSSLEGHVIPVEGGISLDLTRMDRVLAVRPHDLTATVQAGVPRSALNRRAGEHGLFFSVDPGADATLGGMAATNASGTTTVRYGSMRANVLGLEVVLADGSVIRTGSRARKTSAGYDVTGLFVGSEGTLGVITEVTVRLNGIPETSVSARATFSELEAACRTAVAAVGAGLTLTRAELLEEGTLRAVNAYEGTSFEEVPSLFLELSGSEAAVLGDLELARELAETEGCLSFVTVREAEAQRRLWEARHHAGLAVIAASPGKGKKSTDVCVPISELPDAIRLARRLIEERELDATMVAHAGDGNYHLIIALDPGDPSELEAAEAVNAELVEHALACGGTCSGEHGIGLGKIRFLEREHGDLLPIMRGVKRLLDPRGILNPGKVLSPGT